MQAKGFESADERRLPPIEAGIWLGFICGNLRAFIGVHRRFQSLSVAQR
jgi:hypothetical protein